MVTPQFVPDFRVLKIAMFESGEELFLENDSSEL